MNTFFFTANSAKNIVRHETFEGRDHLVVPVVSIRAGVVNGELAPAAEILASLPAWDGVPFTVNHPAGADGVPVSANSPAMLEKVAIGRTFNSKFENNKLKQEIWLDVEKARALGGKALQTLQRAEAGEPLEVSTGYFCDREAVTGTDGGNAYDSIQRNIRPNHLAALPNGVGACSWQDGCGAPRINNAQGKASMKDKILNFLAQMVSGVDLAANHDLAYSDTRQAILGKLNAERQPGGDYSSIEEVFGDSFVFSSGMDNQLFKRSYSVNPATGELSLGADAQKVQRKTDYIPTTNQEGQVMDRAEQITALIANCACKIAETDRPLLEKLSDGAFSTMALNCQAQAAAPAVNAQAPAIPDGMALVSLEAKAMIEAMLAANATKKTALVAKITANAKNMLTQPTLESLAIDALEGLDKMLNPAPVVNSFIGASGNVAPAAGAIAINTVPPPPSSISGPCDAK